jgi:transposase
MPTEGDTDMQEIDAIVDQMQISRVDHLPIMAAFCRRIGLIETVNATAGTGMAVDVGTVVQAMVLDTVSTRSPLYRVDKFVAAHDTEVLLGRLLPSQAFNDTNLGRALDAIYEAGSGQLFSQVALKAAAVSALDMRHVHFDTTSVNVWGEYDTCSEKGQDDRLNITYGHSKDKRPDLKQFMIKMLCVHRNIPILGGCEDGNASDKTLNKALLSRLSSYLADHGVQPGGFVYIADSALVTPDNLNEIGPNLFITRLPFTYKETDRVVAEAVADDCWAEVGAANETSASRKRPAACYRVCEKEVTVARRQYRAIVVHSSAHDKRRLKRIDRQLKESRMDAEKRLRQAVKIEYFCRKDAEEAAKRLAAKHAQYHQIEPEVIERIKYARGRPPKNGERKVSGMTFFIGGIISERALLAQQKREQAGCFVLLTNTPTDGDMGHTPQEVLLAYKEQHGIERDFGFLKDPLIVNDLFLKKPERIEALGFILLTSLLIWALVEHAMRSFLQSTQTKLPGWDSKPTSRPTTFMLSTKFSGLQTVSVAGRKRLAQPLNSTQVKYLAALGLNDSCMCRPI